MKMRCYQYLMQKLLLPLMTFLATTSFGFSEIKMEGAKATLEKGNQRFTDGKGTRS